MFLKFLKPFLVLLLIALSPSFANAQNKNEIIIFAASSLTDAVKEIGANYQAITGVKITYSFASSALISKQIEAGAPADIIMTADSDWMDYIQNKNLIQTKTRTNLLGGHLVLIAPKSDNPNLTIAPNFPIAQYLGPQGKIAIANPDYVPAGKYAKSSLIKYGVWDKIADNIIRTENVRMALNYVARGDAKLGIVYKSDAFVEKNIKIIAEFPDNSHQPIIYPIALSSKANSNAIGFYNYLKSPYAMGIYGNFGFNSAAEILGKKNK